MKLGYLPCYVGPSIYPFDELFNESVRVEKPSDVVECDAILLWGGEDIASSYYGEAPHPANQNRSGKPSQRDIREWDAMMMAKQLGLPIIGVCRGAQFLCAFAGGKLIQHMSGHHGDHLVKWEDGQVYQTSSCHHQAMLPGDVEHQVLAVSEDDSILECVYFPKVKGFAIQGHPEWMSADSPYVQKCFSEIRKLLEIEHAASVE